MEQKNSSASTVKETACQRGQKRTVIIVQESIRATTRLITSPLNTAVLNTISDALMGCCLKWATTWEKEKVAWPKKNQDFFCIVLMEGLELDFSRTGSVIRYLNGTSELRNQGKFPPVPGS